MSLVAVKTPGVVQSLTDVLARPEELPDVETFRIASYNAWNLFGEAPDVHSGRPSPPAGEEQLEALGQMILSLDADAIAFQEVQNEKVLASLFREYVNPKIKDKAYRFNAFCCIPARDPRGINVALATRFAVRGEITFHDREFGPLEDNPMRFSRDLLGVELMATPQFRFLFFVAHLKSKMGGEKSEQKRLVEVGEIRDIFENPQFGSSTNFIDQPLVLCGDMNDDPDTQVIERLVGAEPRQLRDILGPDVHSYPTHKKYKKTRLDYILASKHLDISDAKVHSDDLELAQTASDHFPVSATVRVG